MVNVPAVVIAAPASGSGKTTLATGLIGALRRAGHRVAPFKVGPDYIDPGYHGLAAGRPGRNLDPVLVGADRVVPLYQHGSRDCDLAVVEGVMGLFDGRIDENHSGPVAEGSTAQVASLLGAPVILVVDARGHSQSLAALLHGFATFDSGIRLGGVILNRVGSERHDQVLRAACARVGLPVLGSLPRMAELEVPSRHLGLIPAVEHGVAATNAVAAMTDLIAAHVDLAAIAALSRTTVSGPAWDPIDELRAAGTGSATAPVRAGAEDVAAGGAPVLAMAGGPAFTFGYAEHRELLLAAGAEVAVFDPLHDELPTGAAGLVLPGGFPEEHAAALAANIPLLRAVAQQAEAGLPIHAECAGLLYLTRALDGHSMAGVVDAEAEFGPRLTLGYRDAVALADSPLWRAGERVRGHEFHRTRLISGATADPAWGWHGSQGERVREGALIHRVHASYLHTHPAGNPAATARFVAAAAAFAGARVPH
ncbi:cobyrinate a,c-diamide synthase [Nocardia sp. NPDC050435]|uniref:cobyrinate a,c-diamide synthase n=1 Tax=Nocardia sp. NPDC050435 TaxID=3155040 RepID=UPI0033DBE01D